MCLKKHMIYLTLALSVPLAVWANGFRNPEDGAAALGQLGGKTVWVEDPSATIHNPANLSEQPAAVQASVNWVHGSVEYDASLGGTWETEGAGEVLLPSVGVAWPLGEGGRGALGLAIHSPYGQFTEWPKDVLFGYSSPYYAEMRTINVTPAFAWRAHENLRVGIGLDIMHSTLNFRQLIPWGMFFGNPAMPAAEADLEGDGMGFGAHAGMTMMFSGGQRLALTIRSPIDIEHNGDARINYIPPQTAGIPELQSVQSVSRFRSTIHFPAQVGLGYGAQISERLSVGFDLEWLGFSSQDNLVIDLGRNQPLMPDRRMRQDWEDTITLAVGTRYQLCETLELRAGYKFMESPIPTETMSPILIEGDQHMVGLGLGYQCRNMSIDLAYVLGINEDVTLTRLMSDPSQDGHYETSMSHLVALSASIPF